MSRIYQLFGGAITITLPSNLLDVAELRQVADTQEVYVEDNSTVSFLVDITQSVPVPLKEYRAAIEYHYTNLAEENAAAESGIRSVDVQQCQVRQECHGPILLVGQQAVAKFRKGNDQAELVDVFMALWRIPTRNAEITLTVCLFASWGLTACQCSYACDRSMYRIPMNSRRDRWRNMKTSSRLLLNLCG